MLTHSWPLLSKVKQRFNMKQGSEPQWGSWYVEQQGQGVSGVCCYGSEAKGLKFYPKMAMGKDQHLRIHQENLT